MISGEVLKYLNGLFIRVSHERLHNRLKVVFTDTAPYQCISQTFVMNLKATIESS